jgi:uncharacterized membrane protein YkoI
MKRSVILLATFCLSLVPAASAEGKNRDSRWERVLLAQNQDGWGNQFSPGQARDAVKEGRTVPLSRIFQSLKREYGGYQLGADLYSKDSGGAVYEIDWLTDDGRKVHVTVDAETGAVLDRRGG